MLRHHGLNHLYAYSKIVYTVHAVCTMISKTFKCMPTRGGENTLINGASGRPTRIRTYAPHARHLYEHRILPDCRKITIHTRCGVCANRIRFATDAQRELF